MEKEYLAKFAQAQTNVGRAYLGDQTAPPAPGPVPMLHLDAIDDRIQRLQSSLSEIVGRTQAIGDRLVGGESQDDMKNGIAPSRGGKLGNIQDRMDHVEALVSALFGQLHRIEQVVL